MKSYILQKDLPDAKVGDEYIYNDGMVDVNAYYKNGNPCESYWLPTFVESNEVWFKKKEEVKPIVNSWTANYTDINFVILINPDSPYLEIKISRQRLAEILIAESKGDVYLDKDEYRREEFFTREEMLDAEEQAWNAARAKHGYMIPHGNINTEFDTYANFSDYKNNQNK